MIVVVVMMVFVAMIVVVVMMVFVAMIVVVVMIVLVVMIVVVVMIVLVAMIVVVVMIVLVVVFSLFHILTEVYFHPAVTIDNKITIKIQRTSDIECINAIHCLISSLRILFLKI